MVLVPERRHESSRERHSETSDGGCGQPGGAESKLMLVDEVIDEIGFGRYQIFLMALCGLGWAADIMDLQMLSYLIPTLSREWDEPLDRLSMAAEFTFLGMMCGSLFWGMASDRVGRKPAFMLTSLLASCAGLLSATSGSIGTFVTFRFVQVLTVLPKWTCSQIVAINLLPGELVLLCAIRRRLGRGARAQD